MKKFWVCYFAALCMALSGCAEGQQEVPSSTAGIPIQTEASPQWADSEGSAEPEGLPEKQSETSVYSDQYTGAWRDMDDPQYNMTISSEDGSSYTIETIRNGGSQGTTIWQLTGTYDDIWNGIAYVGAKYEEIIREDASVQRIPVPEREEITGLFYFEEDGTLSWIEDFDHAGDELHFVKE